MRMSLRRERPCHDASVRGLRQNEKGGNRSTWLEETSGESNQFGVDEQAAGRGEVGC